MESVAGSHRAGAARGQEQLWAVLHADAQTAGGLSDQGRTAEGGRTADAGDAGERRNAARHRVPAGAGGRASRTADVATPVGRGKDYTVVAVRPTGGAEKERAPVPVPAAAADAVVGPRGRATGGRAGGDAGHRELPRPRALCRYRADGCGRAAGPGGRHAGRRHYGLGLGADGWRQRVEPTCGDPLPPLRAVYHRPSPGTRRQKLRRPHPKPLPHAQRQLKKHTTYHPPR